MATVSVAVPLTWPELAVTVTEPAARALLCDYGAKGIALSFEQPRRGAPPAQIASLDPAPPSGAPGMAALTE